MLPKSHRLLTKQFDEVMKSGRVAHSSLFILRYISGQPDTRISASVSTKIAKTAVARVRIRRTIYREVRPFMDMLKSGVHGVIFSKGLLEGVTGEQIQAEIKELFTKAGIIVG